MNDGIVFIVIHFNAFMAGEYDYMGTLWETADY